ncbi:protein KHNYN [Halichoeres trimaculatus]|uniref:protein KHNYN n=1 Tax=Halichoeres trimaculatus TaxID=147232 RepID=UPI003D9DBEAD
MDDERTDGGAEAEVEDEFACAGVLRGSLTSLHATVERIFSVKFGIGGADSSQGNNGQIWLKLQGRRKNVTAAKLFVKGVVNQEEQQEVSYPGVLHCVFCGARGLFMDCLIRSTSAHIVVGSSGFLLISGLAEPVVRAYSLIMDLVERYEGTQSRRAENGDRVVGESLDSRRAFKTLVEDWEDRHILDLLVLPGSVKEILLDLVKDSGLGSGPSLDVREGSTRPQGDLDGRWDGTSDQWVEGLSEGLQKDSKVRDPLFQSGGTPGERLTRSPQEVGEEEQPEQAAAGGTTEKEGHEEEVERQLNMGNKEFWLLLKFFTAMGYTEDVVKRVLARTGPKEASQILDLVQQEQDCSDKEKMIEHSKDKPKQDNGGSDDTERNRPCETEHREDEEAPGGDKLTGTHVMEEVVHSEENAAMGSMPHFDGKGTARDNEEEDFVLGVLKKAAASCGYMEQNVAEVYNRLPEGSTHQLLLELQKDGSKELGAFKEEPREMDDVELEKKGLRVGLSEVEGHDELFRPAEQGESVGRGWAEVEVPNLTVKERNLLAWLDEPKQHPSSQYTSQPKQQHPPKSQTAHQILPDVKGPPMSTYTSSLDPPLTNIQTSNQYGQTSYGPKPSPSKLNHPNHNSVLNPMPPKRGLHAHQLPSSRADSPPARARDRRGFTAPPSVAVTGPQRFLEGLQTGFQLQLTDKPGVPNLRTIIIDGSNVAMSHGLGHFFSCRGIALAVQHFWDRGHRDITAFLPQWRQKSDPKIKEQHYLTEMQNLGLVAFTPSREVQGKRISSYDDRFMLQLAQKTNGVIVTNDNLRDLSDETAVWRDIIKKRLLQYTFVGDHFMVPDDPLGRGGPHLDDFLRSEHRTPDPGNHSFAGVSTTVPSSKPPRPHTEVLNYRDRTPGVAVDVTRGGYRGRGRGRGQLVAPDPELVFRADRSPGETASLREQLSQVFPGQDNMVTLVLQSHPKEMDINVLSDVILQLQKD